MGSDRYWENQNNGHTIANALRGGIRGAVDDFRAEAVKLNSISPLEAGAFRRCAQRLELILKAEEEEAR